MSPVLESENILNIISTKPLIMIKKLLNKMNFQTISVSRSTSLLTLLFIIILYLGGVSNLQGQSATFSESSETLTYDFKECASFSGDNS